MIRLVIALGGLLGSGLWLAYSGLRPAPPRLAAALARLNTEDPTGTAAGTDGRRGPLAPVLNRLIGRLAGQVTVPRRDLALLAKSPDRFIAEKLAWAAAGLLLPPALTAAAMAAGTGTSWTVPAGGALALAAIGFFIPDLTVRSAAAQRRADFRYALSAYLDLVLLAVSGGSGPAQALERAPRHSSGWAFTRIAQTIQAAQHARIPPWEGLARLGTQIGVDELVDLADMAELAGSEGTRIADSITAYTQQMRTRRLTELRAQAGARTTTMTAPIATLALAFIVLLAYPQIHQLLNP